MTTRHTCTRCRANGGGARVGVQRNTYTPQEYRPQAIHDMQMSSPDANGRRTLMVLGSQPAVFRLVQGRVRAGLANRDRLSCRARPGSTGTGVQTTIRRSSGGCGRMTCSSSSPRMDFCRATSTLPFVITRSLAGPPARSIRSRACRVISCWSGSTRRGKRAASDPSRHRCRPRTPSCGDRTRSVTSRSRPSGAPPTRMCGRSARNYLKDRNGITTCGGAIPLRLFDGRRQQHALPGLYRARQPRPDLSGPARPQRALRHGRFHSRRHALPRPGR